MVSLGVILLVVSGVLATYATMMSCQVNPDTSLPWVFGTRSQKPWRVRVTYGLAGAAGALGASQLFGILGYWAFLMIIGAWVVAFVVQFRHNHGSGRRSIRS